MFSLMYHVYLKKKINPRPRNNYQFWRCLLYVIYNIQISTDVRPVIEYLHLKYVILFFLLCLSRFYISCDQVYSVNKYNSFLGSVFTGLFLLVEFQS